MWGLALLADEQPRYRGAKRLWSMAEDARIRREFPDRPTRALARDLGRSYSGTCIHAAKLGLTKSAAYVASGEIYRLNGTQPGCRSSQFKPGQTPHNKGRRYPPGWAPGRMRETQFKKGARSGKAGQHWMPIGSTRLVEGYVYRKVSDVPNVAYTVNWKAEHVLVWATAHGPVPAGHVVIFRNGDRADIRDENLECISRVDLMRRNTVHNLPTPIAQAVQLLGALNRSIRRRTRATEKQDLRSA